MYIYIYICMYLYIFIYIPAIPPPCHMPPVSHNLYRYPNAYISFVDRNYRGYNISELPAARHPHVRRILLFLFGLADRTCALRSRRKNAE